ncbi:MAG: MFS transporter [Clostridia bacterium]|nr:MFS transporter [Clostridia bacterium]MBR1686011.1 MFS transporter [Clostridia bacterium]
MEKDSRLKPYLLCIFSYFVLGCMVLTINTINSSIITEYGWKDSQGALLITFMAIGNLFMSIVGNLFTDKIGRNRALALYILMAAGGLGIMSILHTPGLYYFLMLLVGFAWGGINTLVNTVPTELYNGSSSRLNIMHACYAIGAVLFPLIVGFMLKHGLSWRAPVWVVLLLFAIQLLSTFLVRLPTSMASERSKSKDKKTFAFWKELSFYLSTLTFLFYVGVESAISTWLSPYLAQENAFFATVPAQTMVSLMWLMLLIGRLVFSALGTRIPSKPLLVFLSTGFLLGILGLFFFGRITSLAILSVILTGLSMSAVYGVAVSVGARYVKASAVASGIMFGAGGFGSAIIPYISGLVSDASCLRAGILSLSVFLTLLLLSSIANLRTATNDSSDSLS